MTPEEPIGDIFPTRSRKPGIKICPRCGSIDVNATTGTGYVSPPLYVCNRCNFSGSIFPEVEGVEALKELKRSADTMEGESGSSEEPQNGGAETDEEDTD